MWKNMKEFAKLYVFTKSPFWIDYCNELDIIAVTEYPYVLSSVAFMSSRTVSKDILTFSTVIDVISTTDAYYYGYINADSFFTLNLEDFVLSLNKYKAKHSVEAPVWTVHRRLKE